ncbi:MAG: IS5 family transposase [Trichodesmium sp. St2_bin6]|nr:IS5 family transposase [Trichodesmium sp. St2_bin6]
MFLYPFLFSTTRLSTLYSLARRQTEGFWESIFSLMRADLPVPDHTTLSRRLGKLNIHIPVMPTTEAIHLVVDSTGVKVYGEGEWKTRIHGVGKRRTWRKLHLGVNEATGEIVTAVVSTNDISDDQVFCQLPEVVESEIAQVLGDGAYDQRKCYSPSKSQWCDNRLYHRSCLGIMVTVNMHLIPEMRTSERFVE